MSRQTRARLALALLLSAGAAAAEPPRCIVEVEVEPAHVVVGQQLLYTVRIVQRRDVESLEWEQPLSFPAFRAEWLPGISADAPLRYAGEGYQAFLERRALFPAGMGLLEIPAAALRCGGPDGEEIVPIPAARVRVDGVTDVGRPDDWIGLIGPVVVSRTVSPAAIAVGGSLRVSVVVQGDTNLWAANDPGAPLRGLPGVEVFERPAELSRDAGRRLGVRRYFSYDLVPHDPGPLTLPAVRVPYYDPGRGLYDTATAPPLRVEVAPGAPPDPARPPTPTPTAEAPAPSGSRGPGALLLVALLGGAVLWLVVGRFRRTTAGPGSETPGSLLAEARRAAASGEREHGLRAAQRALEAALARSAGAKGEAGREARALIDELERARFAADCAAPDLARVEAALEAL